MHLVSVAVTLSWVSKWNCRAWISQISESVKVQANKLGFQVDSFLLGTCPLRKSVKCDG